VTKHKKNGTPRKYVGLNCIVHTHGTACWTGGKWDCGEGNGWNVITSSPQEPKPKFVN